MTQIGLDDDALAETMRLAGARTKQETVNLALRELVARHRQGVAIERYGSLAARWDYEVGKRHVTPRKNLGA